MKRTILFAAILMSGMTVKAQTGSSFGAMDGTPSAFQHPQQVGDTNNIHKKWSLTKYAGVSTGFVAFRGGSTSFLSVPLALQVNRQLTPNLFAFGAVSVAPSVFRSYGMPYQPGMNKGYSLMQPNNFAAYSDAKIGVMYISNDKTFSISGSIGVSRGGYGGYNNYSPFYTPAVYSPSPPSPVRGHGQL
ncbi:hypothetical protein [Chitinophaga sp.]|uniref:hypothetical protein n=1 Tax=Chitinophaga sp. TaxID=1869181 RepID=UPI002F94A979